MMPRSFRTSSAEETVALGREIAGELRPPQGVLLVGDLGAGKTTFTKGLIAGLGSATADEVLSPTFSLIHEYDGPPKVYHIDLYRLDRVPELETLGLDDIWDEPAIVLIEWGEKFEEQFPGEVMRIDIRDLDGDEREIRIGTEGGLNISAPDGGPQSRDPR
jgi:tRNA threonylcarbamoyladenosine biosynthesis protein TsaE